MSYTEFSAEQLVQVERADLQQNEFLRDWLLSVSDRNCEDNASRVLTTDRACFGSRRAA